MLVFPTTFSNKALTEDDNDALKPLAELLEAQLWGLLPGSHRLMFEGGHVLLTLCIGDVVKMLRQLEFEVDLIDLKINVLDLTSTGTELLYAAKAIARLCKVGTELTMSINAAMQTALHQCGFVVATQMGQIKATYKPAWVTKKPSKSVKPGSCVVVGAGLAGAAVASSLARRGWAVTVLDAASKPASGASGLPAGLLVPHTSPDDGLLSRLSRAGVRMTLQHARALLRHGIDWGHTGVLQRSFGGDKLNLPMKLPPAWAHSLALAARDWGGPATASTLATARLPSETSALWHAKAGWVKPAALVNAWLTLPGIAWHGSAKVTQLIPNREGWLLLDAAGIELARADLVVLAAGYASQTLTASAGAAQPDLQAIRGQVTFGLQKDSDPLPPFAVNGHGGLISAITTDDGPMWLMGAGYERDVQVPDIKAQDHADNLTRLQHLLPDSALALADQFNSKHARGWAGIRCATPNRLPLVRPVAPGGAGLWLCTGMGSRGLSFAALCAELLAARLHGEPLPIESQLARAMGATPDPK